LQTNASPLKARRSRELILSKRIGAEKKEAATAKYEQDVLMKIVAKSTPERRPSDSENQLARMRSSFQSQPPEPEHTPTKKPFWR